MTVQTGADGQLIYRGRTIAKCRSWTLTMNNDAIETTALGEWDRTYVPGLRGATGTTSLYFDGSDTAQGCCCKVRWKISSDDLTFVLNKNGNEAMGMRGHCDQCWRHGFWWVRPQRVR